MWNGFILLLVRCLHHSNFVTAYHSPRPTTDHYMIPGQTQVLPGWYDLQLLSLPWTQTFQQQLSIVTILCFSNAPPIGSRGSILQITVHNERPVCQLFADITQPATGQVFGQICRGKNLQTGKGQHSYSTYSAQPCLYFGKSRNLAQKSPIYFKRLTPQAYAGILASWSWDKLTKRVFNTGLKQLSVMILRRILLMRKIEKHNRSRCKNNFFSDPLFLPILTSALLLFLLLFAISKKVTLNIRWGPGLEPLLWREPPEYRGLMKVSWKNTISTGHKYYPSAFFRLCVPCYREASQNLLHIPYRG